jgi:ubiquitin-like protein Nedd8
VANDSQTSPSLAPDGSEWNILDTVRFRDPRRDLEMVRSKRCLSLDVRRHFRPYHKACRANGGQGTTSFLQQNSTSFDIFVKPLWGGKLTMSVTPIDTVWKLKARIQDKTGHQPDQQRLIFGGKQLADHRILDEYKIFPGCVIHLVLRLRGGFDRQVRHQ